MHVYTFEQEEWVVAESPEDASKVFAEHSLGTVLPEPGSDGEWTQLSDDKVLTMRDVEGDAGGDESRTCAEWAAGGRRYLGSASY